MRLEKDVEEAARGALAGAIGPRMEAAQAELKAATEERDRIVAAIRAR
jgi:hypothetical protein